MYVLVLEEAHSKTDIFRKFVGVKDSWNSDQCEFRQVFVKYLSVSQHAG